MNGLTNEEVKKSREKYGTNEITKTKNKKIINIFVDNLGDPIIRILLIALAVKIVFLLKDFDWYETIGIVASILLASIVSTISEYGSEKAFEKLEKEASMIESKVVRDKKVMEVKTNEIVKGDIIILESGDKVPADGNVVEGKVYVDESLINGESKEKLKSFNDKLYRGTIVTEGKALIHITDVGNNTAYGKIAQELQIESEESPLKTRLRCLAETISKIGYIGASLVAISYLFNVIVIHNNFNYSNIMETLTNFRVISGYILHALTLCVTVIIVSVPEGLPMMITLVLSSNMKKLLKSNVLVRKLTGIETTGSLNILFTDKTGTLTKGKLEVVGIMSPNLEIEGYPEIIQNKLLKENIILNNDASNTIKLGKSYIYPDYDIKLDVGNFFSNHFAILGNSGSGKSCGVARILQNLFFDRERVPVNAHIVLFDVYGEYNKAFLKLNNISSEIEFNKPKAYIVAPDILIEILNKIYKANYDTLEKNKREY